MMVALFELLERGWGWLMQRWRCWMRTILSDGGGGCWWMWKGMHERFWDEDLDR